MTVDNSLADAGHNAASCVGESYQMFFFIALIQNRKITTSGKLFKRRFGLLTKKQCFFQSTNNVFPCLGIGIFQ